MVNESEHTASLNGQDMDITRYQFSLLQYLVRERGRVCSREEILVDALNYNIPLGVRSVDVHVNRLRDALGTHRNLIRTVLGVGYGLDPSAAKSLVFNQEPENGDFSLSVSSLVEADEIIVETSENKQQGFIRVSAANLLGGLAMPEGSLQDKFITLSANNPAQKNPEVLYLADGRVSFNTNTLEATFDNVPCTLPLQQAKLLKFFCDNPNITFPRRLLYDRVWRESNGYGYGDSSRTIDMHVAHLRKASGQESDLADTKSGYIRTIRGLGYRAVTSLDG